MTDAQPKDKNRRTSPAVPKGHSLGEFPNYQDATKLVERLIAGDFAPNKISIIGHNPVLVERVRSRLGYGRVALSGAVTGFWIGLIFALLLGTGIEVTPEGGVNYLPQQFFSVLVVGAGLGMLFQVIRFSATKNKRSFLSSQMPIATRYEVIVPDADALSALKIIGLAGSSE
ncbi:MAG: hypothetical protein RLZ99_507 [Actinomycetota bacterium]|jgi:hypothetical protein